MSAVARARVLLGVRFRAHGRDPRFGLDCVGLAGAAVGIEVPGGYALRTGDPAAIERALADAGLMPVIEAAAGDLLLLHAGPGQLHLAISTGGGIIHADARARRVVERPDVPWPVLSIWRR
jgi:cell wall-associated NlpC family hydrolase